MNLRIVQANAVHLPLSDRSVDLVFGSPPYCDARTYGIGIRYKCDAWIDWMFEVTTEALRVARNCVVWVAAGVTRDRNYWPACEGLMYRWWQSGGHAYRPCVFHRSGICGSGGTDWFRSNWEYIMCFKRPGELPWSNNTACGHPPKYAPGGEMSHRVSDGTRINQWGGGGTTERGPDGQLVRSRVRPSHRQHTKRKTDGTMDIQNYSPPVIANPGNVLRFKVGGGHMGSKLAHENEAPMPEKLAEFFILSLCDVDGVVLDPFSGSGTTATVAVGHDRRAIAMDLRFDQCELTHRRVKADAGLFVRGG